MNNQEYPYEKEIKRSILLAMILIIFSVIVSSLVILLSTKYLQESHDQNSNPVLEDTITPPETDTIIIHSADEQDQVSPANPKQSE